MKGEQHFGLSIAKIAILQATDWAESGPLNGGTPGENLHPRTRLRGVMPMDMLASPVAKLWIPSRRTAKFCLRPPRFWNLFGLKEVR